MSESMLWRKDPIHAAERGEHPLLVARLCSGFVVMSPFQLLPGSCILLASPKVHDLTSLSDQARTIFLREMSLVGEAIVAVCKPRRMNYAMYGNTDPYLHAHIIPRYEWEEPERARQSLWTYPPTALNDPTNLYDETRHGVLRERLERQLAPIARGLT